MTDAHHDRPAGEHPRPASEVVDAALAGLPFLELPAGPTAPEFDGSQVCAQVDPELFFPLKGGQAGRVAKRLCGSCEFLNPCRRYALTARVAGFPIAGIWGGTSDRDRMHLRRAAAAAAEVDELVDADADVDADVA